MLDGIMEYSYGREHYRMEQGDTLQFEGDIPHGPTKLVKLPIRFLSITIYGGDRPVARRPVREPIASATRARPARSVRWRWTG